MSPPKSKKPITYDQAGVSLKRAETWNATLKKCLPPIPYPNVEVSGIGSFAAMHTIPKTFGSRPILLTACDGVGTKLKYPVSSPRKLATLGEDLVAMSANDIAACGGAPFLFLDYLACGKIDVSKYRWVLKGIQKALTHCRCMLAGGETAEMPLCYNTADYDLAGFMVGLAQPKQLLNPKQNIKKGHVIIGLPSNGIHSNGYSLIHKVFSKQKLKELESHLFKPTRLYTPFVPELIQKYPKTISGAAHITGGGFYENLARIIPETLSVHIQTNTWRKEPAFKHIEQATHLSHRSLYETFNMGMGFTLFVKPKAADTILALCKKAWPKSTIIGEVHKRTHHAVDLT